MTEKKKSNYRFYAGRIGFRGAPTFYLKTKWNLDKVELEHPSYTWAVITQEAYDKWVLLML